MFKLSDNNYYNVKHKKNIIVIGNTFATDMNHYIGWTLRFNGGFKRTAHFTILKDGTIHNHFPTDYYSDFIGNDKQDKQCISIVLENQGWLIKDSNEENKFINYLGHIYNKQDVVKKNWRNFKYWEPYTNEQYESLIKLTKELCQEHDIKLNVVEHNTNISNLDEYSILYRSNFTKYYTDVSPTFDFNNFKEKLQINE